MRSWSLDSHCPHHLRIPDSFLMTIINHSCDPRRRQFRTIQSRCSVVSYLKPRNLHLPALSHHLRHHRRHDTTFVPLASNASDLCSSIRLLSRRACLQPTST
ncbi:hypothetical protein BDZ89DRAFT_1059002 [Hymenopellis radicata]|nr:hypothetical protein BDZ89DRAFT_1059002 [Hymenopellis radicata]